MLITKTDAQSYENATNFKTYFFIVIVVRYVRK
jgi:hypothetical protein